MMIESIQKFYKDNKVILKNISSKLNKLSSIEEKLDFLKELVETLEKDKIFGITVHFLVYELKDEHFKNADVNPKFTYWFLNHNAYAMFKNYINEKEFKRKISSNEKARFINDKLKKIEDDAFKARQLQTDGFINSSDNYKPKRGVLYLFDENHKSIEVLRILEGNYYENYPTTHEHTVIESPEVVAYFNHVFLKPYLEKEFKNITKPSKKLKGSKNYTQKQVAIAYFILGKPITEDTYLSILKKHTQTTSNKILQKRCSSTSRLTTISENKTADTRHLKDLDSAKRLISSMKNKEAKNSITQVISTFEDNYKNYYE